MKNASVVLVIILFLRSCFSDHDPNDSCGGCLFLSPYIKQGKPEVAREMSQVDSAAFFGLKSHAGFLNVNEKYGSNQFFWFFPAEELKVTPWIIWLGGGPGVTALKGLFELMGPLQIIDDEVQLRNITWASDYSVLYLDVPVGAGFSFSESEEGYTDNVEDAGLEMLVFLQQFLQIFPELEKAPLFITGQSYAGKYVPALAIQIHRNRKNKPINLRGIAMGNGLVELRNMMAYSQLCKALGILDDKEIQTLIKIELDVVKYIDAGRMVDAANKFNETIEFIKKRSGVNIYKFNEGLPSNTVPAFESYLSKPKTRDLIHVGNATFNFNNQKVYEKMLPDIANSTKQFVEELLEHYGVMSYNGQLDIIVPHSLLQNVFETLKWSNRHAYKDAPKTLIYDDDDKLVAHRKCGGNFVNVLILDAGHSAPADQPEAAKIIIDQFIDEFM